MLIAGGRDSTDGLGTAYVIWDFIGAAGWENIPGNTTAPAPWREDATSLEPLGASWGTYTNFPLSIGVDTMNNSVYIAFVCDASGAYDCLTIGADTVMVKHAKVNTSMTTFSIGMFPTVTEASDMVLSLTSDQNDIYLFYILDPQTNGLVYRKCNPRVGGNLDMCDNLADWGSETTLDNDTTVSHPQAVVSKAFGDSTAIDVIYTDTTDTAVRYERHFVNNADKTIVVAAAGDDAEHIGSVQDIDSTTVRVGLPSATSHAGIRFPSVAIPQASSISSAYLDVKIIGVAVVDFTIYGEDVADSAIYTDVASCTGDGNCVANRSRTSSSITNTVAYPSSTTFRFDVTDIIQEIVCQGAASAQPCVGTYYEDSGDEWASGNDLSLLLISSEADAGVFASIVSYDNTSGTLKPTLQVNLGNSGKRYSMGVTNAPAVSTDLDHPMSQEQFSGVNTDDTVFASVSASLVPSASSSANPVFLFKVNNTNNNNTDDLSATAIVKSTIPTNSYGGGHDAGKPIYLQLYHTTNGWETKDTESATAADTEITLDSGTVTGSTSYYQSESPGGTCSGSDCWAAWRIYQDAAPEGNEVLSVDIFSALFSSSGPTIGQVLRHGAWFNASGIEQPFTF